MRGTEEKKDKEVPQTDDKSESIDSGTTVPKGVNDNNTGDIDLSEADEYMSSQAKNRR